MNPTLFALTAFVSWALFLIILMEVLRCRLIMVKAVAATDFRPDNANLSPFMQRLARAHANCVESLPIFGGLMLVALIGNKTAVTDPLAGAFLIARLVQSCTHLASSSMVASYLRFSAFVVQMGFGAYWAGQLLMG